MPQGGVQRSALVTITNVLPAAPGPVAAGAIVATINPTPPAINVELRAQVCVASEEGNELFIVLVVDMFVRAHQVRLSLGYTQTGLGRSSGRSNVYSQRLSTFKVDCWVQ